MKHQSFRLTKSSKSKALKKKSIAHEVDSNGESISSGHRRREMIKDKVRQIRNEKK